jgi:hypothetical protein
VEGLWRTWILHWNITESFRGIVIAGVSSYGLFVEVDGMFVKPIEGLHLVQTTCNVEPTNFYSEQLSRKTELYLFRSSVFSGKIFHFPFLNVVFHWHINWNFRKFFC